MLRLAGANSRTHAASSLNRSRQKHRLTLQRVTRRLLPNVRFTFNERDMPTLGAKHVFRRTPAVEFLLPGAELVSFISCPVQSVPL